MKKYKCKIVHKWVFEKDVKEDSIYLLKNHEGTITNVFFNCPCKQKDYIMLPIFPKNCGTGWSIEVENKEVTLSPSILRSKCKSHFYIKNSKVVWCGREG
jgi:hypothetical protein